MQSCVGSFIRPPYRILPPEFNALSSRSLKRVFCSVAPDYPISPLKKRIFSDHAALPLSGKTSEIHRLLKA
jgi:hypothetical protein